MAEIRRLTNVLVPNGAGWDTVMYQTALEREIFTDDEVSEIEGALVFFSVNFAMHKRSMVEGILSAAAGLWGLQIVSSTLSEYRSSLTPSTPAESSGEKETQSSIPS